MDNVDIKILNYLKENSRQKASSISEEINLSVSAVLERIRKLENSGIINRITKELYPAIAEHFETTPSKVERAIRHAIDVAWSRGKIENINRIFGFNIYTKNDKPTNGEFIALVADKLSMEQSA